MSIQQQELQQLIDSAVKKINGGKENDICRYIPAPTGEGYIHHFTMRKMKNEQPEELSSMIKTFIINTPGSPASVPPKQRAARGSRKRGDRFLFTREDIEKMLSMARHFGEDTLIKKLIPNRNLGSIKKQLLSSIRRGEVDQELWSLYAEMSKALNSSETSTADANK